MESGMVGGSDDTLVRLPMEVPIEPSHDYIIDQLLADLGSDSFRSDGR
jgi:hypothetical protein